MGISPEYKIIETERLHGNNAIENSSDFTTKKELKDSMEKFLDNYPCPNCGGQRVFGSIIVEICEVKFFQEVWKKGFFGKKLVTEKFNSTWRVSSTYLRPSAFLSHAGEIWCKSCDWQEKGAKGIRWLSINDVRNGNF